MKSAAIPILVCLAFASLSFAESKKRSSPHEQTVFSAEDERVKRPVAIPKDVKALLSRDKVVQAQLENENISAEELPSSWFSASEIRLGKGKKPDVIIVANNPVAGANTTFFWIFRNVGTSHDLILTAQGHSLIVKNTRWNGHPEIELVSVTQQQSNSDLYRFDGDHYTRYKAASEKIQ